MDFYHPENEGAITDLDVCLYNEDQKHLHYIELKQDREREREEDAWEKIQKTARFFHDFDIDVSATELYYEEDEEQLSCHTVTELKEKTVFADSEFEEDKRKQLENPIELMIEKEEIFKDSKSPKYAENRLIPYEKLNYREPDLSSPTVPFDPAVFHPHIVDPQIEKRFDEVPDQEMVTLAYYSNRNPREIDQKYLNDLPENCEYIESWSWSSEEEKWHHLVIRARQPVEEVFNTELID